MTHDFDVSFFEKTAFSYYVKKLFFLKENKKYKYSIRISNSHASESEKSREIDFTVVDFMKHFQIFEIFIYAKPNLTSVVF